MNQSTPPPKGKKRELPREWERTVLQQLNLEYRHTLRLYKIRLVPAFIELSDSEVHWGHWNSVSRTIAISRKLVLENEWFHVIGILKHEMAHQLVDEGAPLHRAGGRSGDRSGGRPDLPHGIDFKLACERLGVPEQYTKASVNLQSYPLDWRTEKQDDVTEKMLEKTRKLLALATSTNENEAALAMNRVREIYAKYNLEHAAFQTNGFVHLVVSTGSTKVTIFDRMIISILVGHFFVEVILATEFSVLRGREERVLELIGRRENVLMAEYVYHFLMNQSRELVEKMLEAQPSHLGRISLVTRRSFRMGILRGFEEKLKAAERPNAHESDKPNLISNAVVAFKEDRELGNYIKKVHPNLRSSRGSSQSIDSSAYNQGRAAGSQISLHKPVSTACDRSSSSRALTGR